MDWSWLCAALPVYISALVLLIVSRNCKVNSSALLARSSYEHARESGCPTRRSHTRNPPDHLSLLVASMSKSIARSTPQLREKRRTILQSRYTVYNVPYPTHQPYRTYHPISIVVRAFYALGCLRRGTSPHGPLVPVFGGSNGACVCCCDPSACALAAMSSVACVAVPGLAASSTVAAVGASYLCSGA